ncbi:MAG: hypothetical protein QM769_05260 [Pseudoxanthomonas sp.]
MSTTRQKIESRHWFGKTMAGFWLGFTLGVALSGVIALLTPGGFVGEGKVQFNMWMIAPIWATVMGFVYLFRDSLRAWLWLGAANALAWAAVLGLKAWLV